MRQYNAKMKKVALEKVKQHEFNKLIGNRKLNLYLGKEMLQYGGVLIAVAVKEDKADMYHVICNYEVVENALSNNTMIIELLVVDCPFNDAPRVYDLHSSFSRTRDIGESYRIITYLKDHMQNTEEGKRWKQDIPGKAVRDKIALLMGWNEGSYIHKIDTIGTYAPDLLGSYLDGEISFTNAYSIAAEIKSEQKNRKSDDARPVNNSRSNEAPRPAAASLWITNSTEAEPIFISSATTTPEFEQPNESEEEPLFTSTQVNVPQFTSPMQTAMPIFYPSSLDLNIDGIGHLNIDLSQHDAKVSFRGRQVSGLVAKINEGKEAKSLQLLKDGMAVVSITILPSKLQ